MRKSTVEIICFENILKLGYESVFLFDLYMLISSSALILSSIGG